MGLKYGLGPYWIVVEVLAVDLRGRLRVNLDSWFYITVFQQISFNYNIFSWLFFNVFFRSFSNRFYSSFSTFFNSDYYVVSRLIFKLIQSFLADNNFLPIILYDCFFLWVKFNSSSKSKISCFQFSILISSFITKQFWRSLESLYTKTVSELNHICIAMSGRLSSEKHRSSSQRSRALNYWVCLVWVFQVQPCLTEHRPVRAYQ